VERGRRWLASSVEQQPIRNGAIMIETEQ